MLNHLKFLYTVLIQRQLDPKTAKYKNSTEYIQKLKKKKETIQNIYMFLLLKHRKANLAGKNNIKPQKCSTT